MRRGWALTKMNVFSDILMSGSQRLWCWRWVRAVPGSDGLTPFPSHPLGAHLLPQLKYSAAWGHWPPCTLVKYNTHLSSLECNWEGGVRGWMGKKVKCPPNTRNFMAILQEKNRIVGWQGALLFTVDDIIGEGWEVTRSWFSSLC